MRYTKEERYKVSDLTASVMAELYGMDGSGRLLNLFIRKLIATSKLKAYGIDDEYKLHVVSQHEIESIDNRICDIIKNVADEAVESFIDFLKRNACNYDLDNYHPFRAVDVDDLADLLREWKAKNDNGWSDT